MTSEHHAEQADTFPIIATMVGSGGHRFLIDQQDVANRDMFSGYKINRAGSIGNGITLTTGSGGRLSFHRSYFVEELPA